MAYRVEIATRAERDLDVLYEQICAQVRSNLQSPSDAKALSKTSENKNLRHLLYGRKPGVYRVIFSRQNENPISGNSSHPHGARRNFKAAE